jgi:DNA invertase Pin-like site-specific DNA recombinase
MTPAKRRDKTIGYMRMSSLDQNEVLQLDGQDLDKVFTDWDSGKDTKPPQLQASP